MSTSAVGLKVPYQGGEVTIVRQLMTDYGKASTYYEATMEGSDKPVMVHQNIVEAVQAGTYVPEPERVKGPRKVSTKKERATKHVVAFKRLRMSRGEIIKALAKKLRISRGTAQTYYYAVK